MELKDKNAAVSDDEEDLEKLRLAALQSLRRTAAEEKRNFQKKSPHNQHKRRHYQGRNVRNGQFYSRPKNTNLISITPVSDESVSDIKPINKKFTEESAPKLILPQDRYCNPKVNDGKTTEPASSKFDRYDNSDKSESESEYEEKSESESESPKKLEKSDSLEALMQELENEIQGDSKPKEEKVKVKVKKRKVKPTVEKVEEKEEIKEVSVQNSTKVEEKEKKMEEKEKKIEEKEEPPKNEIKIEPKKSPKFRNIERKRSPLNKRFFNKKPDRNPHLPNFRHQPYAPPQIYPENSFNQSAIPPFNPHIPFAITNPPPLVPLNIKSDYVHPISRPLSPLNLNTDDVLTITRAPLSPRSAAFVLQNREIVERRKKSPRRSYSRSPSPRYRRSKSPPPYRRSSLSPPRKFIKSKSRSPHPLNLEINRKLSPLKDRVDPIRDRRTPPILDRRSPLLKSTSPVRDRRSPIRNKLSPVPRQRYPDRKSPLPRKAPPNDRSPNQNYRTSPKASVKERLGNRNKQNPEVTEETKPAKPIRKRSRSISLSPEPKEEVIEENPSEVAYDPILEARRKKFETNEIKNTEGIIRLKPKSELTEENEVKMEETVNEDDLLDIFATNVDDIFSDEESDEENEGRFKSNLNTQRNVSVLPFTQLMDTSTRNLKTESLKMNQTSSRTERTSNRKRQRSRSPARSRKERIKDQESKRSTTKDKLYARNRVLFRNGPSRKEKGPVTAPIENKKIEIKIRNPSKYETTSKYDVANELETLERIDKSVRKVEVAEVIKKEPDADLETVDSEIVPDSPEEDVTSDTQSSQKCEAGDLRAQLRRKRAERQNKLPVPEDVQSRLLQNALQGAVFKKPKKSRKEKDSAPKDGKLPIHLRLGFANSMDIFQESKVKRKRSKSKGRIEQV